MPGQEERGIVKVGREFPLLPLKDIVVFPHMVVPVFTSEDICANAIDNAVQNDRRIFLSAFCSQEEDDRLPTSLPPPFDVYDMGLICSIIRTRKLSDGRVRVLVQGGERAKITHLVQCEPYPLVNVQPVLVQSTQHNTAEVEALARAVRENLETVVSLGKLLPPDMLMVLEDVDDPARLSDLVAAHLSLKVQEAQGVLTISSPLERLRKVCNFLAREIEVFRMQIKIQSQAREEIGKVQKEHYLREQIKVMKNELGDGDVKDEIAELWQQVKRIRLSPRAKDEAVRHIKRLEKMHHDTSEASLTRAWLEHIFALPWEVFTVDNLDLKFVKEVLDSDHFGLQTVKDRIIEYLAVKKLNPAASSPILCFVGPPGVGKTSLGRSIARAMGRKFARVALGGVRDEADIRGHRKTYVGAYPGRILQCLKFAESSNPVIMLDEVDKIGADHRGDPAAALLEALDAEQNATFVDHYLGVEFDLSRVLFIANANTMATVPHALRDRLEVIDISGYSEAEKISIASHFLVPKQLSEAGLNSKGLQVSFSRAALSKVINGYTRESGLRTLEKKIASVCRKIARQVVETNVTTRAIKVTPRQIVRQLGAGCVDSFHYRNAQRGVALALAYTPFGGEMLAIETNVLRNAQTRLKLTGQIGEVMNESAQTALSFVVGNAAFFGFDAKLLTANEIHIHIPAGATPKDGPSAGISITTSILSAVLNVAPPQAVALSGEITLHGRVLPVGGLKEKFLAAQRHRVFAIVLPSQNRPAVQELTADIKKNIKIHYVEDYFTAFRLLFNLEHNHDYHRPESHPTTPSRTFLNVS